MRSNPYDWCFPILGVCVVVYVISCIVLFKTDSESRVHKHAMHAVEAVGIVVGFLFVYGVGLSLISSFRRLSFWPSSVLYKVASGSWGSVKPKRIAEIACFGWVVYRHVRFMRTSKDTSDYIYRLLKANAIAWLILLAIGIVLLLREALHL